jgi:hypothetical protein
MPSTRNNRTDGPGKGNPGGQSLSGAESASQARKRALRGIAYSRKARNVPHSAADAPIDNCASASSSEYCDTFAASNTGCLVSVGPVIEKAPVPPQTFGRLFVLRNSQNTPP